MRQGDSSKSTDLELDLSMPGDSTSVSTMGPPGDSTPVSPMGPTFSPDSAIPSLTDNSSDQASTSNDNIKKVTFVEKPKIDSIPNLDTVNTISKHTGRLMTANSNKAKRRIDRLYNTSYNSDPTSTETYNTFSGKRPNDLEKNLKNLR